MERKKIVWPGWEVGPVLGQGGFSTVYEITRENFGQREIAALKVISIPQDPADIRELRSDGYDDASITRRFRSFLEAIVGEYNLMAKLKGHPNIVYCEDLKYVQHDDGIGWDIYIKMEKLTPLSQAGLSGDVEAQALRLGRDICSALVRCREHGILHRDLKPQNIFVSREGSFKLGDFGIAKVTEKTTSGTKVGTYKYMAPEVYKGHPYGQRADVYSLGLVLYWMLNRKRLPFLPLPPQTPEVYQEEESRIRRFRGEPLPPPADGSEGLKRIVLKACAYNPADRYPDAQAMLEDLMALDDRTEGMFYDHTEKEHLRRKAEEAARKEAAQREAERIRQEQQRQQLLEAEKRRREEEYYRQLAEQKTRQAQAAKLERQKKTLIAALAAALVLLSGILLWRSLDSGEEPEPAVTAPRVPVETQLMQTECPHIWREATCRYPRYCAVCGVTEGYPADHRFISPLIGVCRDCGLLTTPQMGMIDCGNYHSVYLFPDGTVTAMGSNKESEYANYGLRCDVWDWENIVQVSAASHTVGLRGDGTVVATGVNRYGQCDLSHWTDIVQVFAGDNHTLGLKSDGTVVAEGYGDLLQLNVSSWKNVVQISAGAETSYGLCSDGTVLATGGNRSGQSDVQHWRDIIQVSAGNYYVAGLRSDGTVVTAGTAQEWEAEYSQWRDIVQISAGSTHLVGLKADGTVVSCGRNDYGQRDVGTWRDIVQVSVGMYHTMGMRSDGSLVCVGSNAYGQLDIADFAPRP